MLIACKLQKMNYQTQAAENVLRQVTLNVYYLGMSHAEIVGKQFDIFWSIYILNVFRLSMKFWIGVFLRETSRVLA